MAHNEKLNGQVQCGADPPLYSLLEGVNALGGEPNGGSEKSTALKLGISMQLQNFRQAAAESKSGQLLNSRQLLKSMVIEKCPPQTMAPKREASPWRLLPSITSTGKKREKTDLESHEALPVFIQIGPTRKNSNITKGGNHD